MIKIKSLFPAVCVILLSILFISCGKDSVTGGNGNPPPSNETLIYSFDSLVARGSGLQGATLYDTIIHQPLSTSMKVVLTCKTDCDSINDSPNIDIQTWDTTSQYLVLSIIPKDNMTYEIRFNVGTSFVINRIIISFVSTLPRYLIAKNIKIYN